MDPGDCWETEAAAGKSQSGKLSPGNVELLYGPGYNKTLKHADIRPHRQVCVSIRSSNIMGSGYNLNSYHQSMDKIQYETRQHPDLCRGITHLRNMRIRQEPVSSKHTHCMTVLQMRWSWGLGTRSKAGMGSD